MTIDAEQLASLRAAAQRGEQARAQQEREARQALVSAAVSDGRIAPARASAWLGTLERDPGAADTLATLEPGLVPVDGPVGHTGGGQQNSADPAAGDDYWFPGYATTSTSREG